MARGDSINDVYKRIYADDLAAALDFEWDYEGADDDDVYEALEAMGYVWYPERSSWLAPEAQEAVARVQKADQVKAQCELARLAAWNAGEPIKAVEVMR